MLIAVAVLLLDSRSLLLFPPLSRCYPLMYRPAVLRWLCADET